ncbi:MAG: peptidase M48 Ste24p [Hyphomonadaceae bacterium]|nr:MAG: peptidase M48 Ste24p [Hyphomonadaceae bacterium]
MTCQFNDGKTARSVAVSPEINSDGLSFVTGENRYIWNFDKLLLIDRLHRKLSYKDDLDARLVLDEDIFSNLQIHAPHLSARAERAKSLSLIAKLAASGVAISAIVFFGVPIAAGPLARMTPPSFELQLSESVESQLDVGMDFCYIDPQSEAILQGLANRISNNANLNFPIKVGVIDMSMPNAFAMPAGKIWFTSGLFQYAKNGNEIAAVLAHEIAHVENRDVLVSIYRAMGFGIILDAVVGGGSGAGQQLVLWGANLTDLKNSREVEARSDRRGLELLEKANIASTGMAVFFERLEKLEKAMGLGDWAVFLSSHPNSGKRAAEAKSLAKTGENAISAADFEQLKKICN